MLTYEVQIWEQLKAAIGNFGVNIDQLFVFYIIKLIDSCKCVTWSQSIDRSLCFPMLLYSGLFNRSQSICPISDAFCTLCPDWLVYAVFLSVGWRWYVLAAHALCSDSPQPTDVVCKQHGQSAQAPVQMDQFTPLQLSLQTFCFIVNLWCKLDLKWERQQVK